MFTSLILGFTHYSQGLAGKCPTEIYSGRARGITEYDPRKTTLTLAVAYCVRHSAATADHTQVGGVIPRV